MLFTFPSRYSFTIGHRGVFRLGGWSPHVQTELHVFRLTQGSKQALPVRGYHPLWRPFPEPSGYLAQITGLFRVRSPLLAESLLMSIPRATEMFQFTRFAPVTYVFSDRYSRSCGFPHSDIRGSKIALISPRLIAECHVLHRLSMPRHPPNALFTLDLNYCPVMHRKQNSFLFTTDTLAKTHIYPLERQDQNGKPEGLRHSPDVQVRIQPLHNVQEHGHDKIATNPMIFYPGRCLFIRAPEARMPRKRGKTKRPNAKRLVELNGIEPMTSCLQSRRSPN